MTHYKVVKRFNSLTDVLDYFDALKVDANLVGVPYKTELYYDDEADIYKVYVLL
jgi:hypothetical protein